MTAVDAMSSDELNQKNQLELKRDKGEENTNGDAAAQIQTTDEGGAAGAGFGNMGNLGNFVNVVKAAAY